MNPPTWVVGLTVAGCLAGTANAADFCADATQRTTVRDFYTESPGAQPAIAAVRTGLSDALVLAPSMNPWPSQLPATYFRKSGP